MFLRPEDILSPAHFEPGVFLDHWSRTHGVPLETLPVGRTLIYSFIGRVGEMGGRLGAHEVEGWVYGPGTLFTAGAGEGSVSVTRAIAGAAMTVGHLEEFIHLGVRRIIGLGWAGSLDPAMPMGSLFVAGEAVREEGTSYHYAEPSVPAVPTGEVAQALLEAGRRLGHPVATGRHWSTDGVYREIRTKVERMARNGVRAVDMETSAMYILGRFRSVEVANLLVISDELFHPWRPAFGTPELRAAEERALDVVLACVETWR